MPRLIASFALVSVMLLLSGCYLDPGYSYVRQTGTQGGAYYGQSRVYDDGYYVAPGYVPYYGGYGYAPGVSLGVGTVWYGGTRYRSYAQPRYRHYDGGRNDWGRNDRGRNNWSRNDQGRSDWGRNDRGRIDQGRSDWGRNDRGRIDQGQIDRGGRRDGTVRGSARPRQADGNRATRRNRSSIP